VLFVRSSPELAPLPFFLGKKQFFFFRAKPDTKIFRKATQKIEVATCCKIHKHGSLPSVWHFTFRVFANGMQHWTL
jgi:hypothetical protein